MQSLWNFCLLAILFGGSGTTDAKETIVIWHTLDVLPADVLKHHLDQFSKDKNVTFRLETGMDIVQSMMETDLISDIPDALVGPSDFIGTC